MSWLFSFVVALLTGVAGLFVTGFVAALLVEWYRISSFEGGAGYFVVFLALAGGIVSGVIGLIVSRVIAGRPRAGFARALGASLAVVLVTAGAVAGIARLLADVAPELDGQALFLSVELRWPEGQTPDEGLRGQPGVTILGALSGSTVRVTEEGPLFVARAASVDGHWVMPGEVRIFTNRGRRLLFFRLGETKLPAFDVPLAGAPGADSRHWSEWLPVNGHVEIDRGFRYRYRVRTASEVLFTERAGPFSIDIRPAGYYMVSDSEQFAAETTFTVRVNDAPVAGLEQVSQAAVLPGDRALLVTLGNDGVCHLVDAPDGVPSLRALGPCGTIGDAAPLTSSQERFERARGRPAPGWLDRTTFDEPGLYQLQQFILDTRSRLAQPFTYLADFPPYGSEPPLALSPDEQSFVILASDRRTDRPSLAVINRQSGDHYAVAIDATRMRTADVGEIGPAWIAHHFAWQSGPGGDRLQERAGFAVLPHHGRLELAKAGAFQSYRLRPGGKPLREALIKALVDGGGHLTTTDRERYEQTVVVDGHEFDLTVGESPSYVMVSMDSAGGDPEAMRALATRLDALLATGQFDGLFVETPPAP